jgi:two-component system sensor histidine kinase MtrB
MAYVSRARFRLRFRTRLSLAFVAVVGVSCGALAISTFVLSRDYRLSSFIRRSQRETEIDTSLVPHPLTAGAEPAIVGAFGKPAGIDVVVLDPGRGEFGSSQLTGRDVPQRLDAAAPGAWASGAVGGHPKLVVASAVGPVRLYFFFSEDELTSGLRRLAALLFGGWAVIVALAALVGTHIARRTLAPVRDASDGARALAEGLLHTRLPVDTDDEFGRWARYFNEMAAALEAKIRDLSEAHMREVRFTADVAHELRTPLAAAISAAAVLEARLDEIPPRVRRAVELMLWDVHRLRRLVLELLELSRLDAGHEPVVTEVLSLAASAAAIRATGGWDGAITIDASPVWVLADRRRIERVISNLFLNAVEHGRPPICVRIRAAGAKGVLEVHDSGDGIAEADRDAIFERFYKPDSARSGPGIGLGLAIAMEHVRLMDGRLYAAAGQDAGATFVLELPRSDPPALPTPELDPRRRSEMRPAIP